MIENDAGVADLGAGQWVEAGSILLLIIDGLMSHYIANTKL
jgi:hypothetical protein